MTMKWILTVCLLAVCSPVTVAEEVKTLSLEQFGKKPAEVYKRFDKEKWVRFRVANIRNLKWEPNAAGNIYSAKTEEGVILEAYKGTYVNSIAKDSPENTWKGEIKGTNPPTVRLVFSTN